MVLSPGLSTPHLIKIILRIDREVMIDDVMMHETRRHLCAKTREKDVVGIVA